MSTVVFIARFCFLRKKIDMKLLVCLIVLAVLGSALAEDSPCDMPKQSGPCRAYFPRFYYDQESSQCDSFVYGGCQGNANNFKTKEECESQCVN